MKGPKPVPEFNPKPPSRTESTKKVLAHLRGVNVKEKNAAKLSPKAKKGKEKVAKLKKGTAEYKRVLAELTDIDFGPKIDNSKFSKIKFKDKIANKTPMVKSKHREGGAGSEVTDI